MFEFPYKDTDFPYIERIREYGKTELYQANLDETCSYSSQVFGVGPIADTITSYCVITILTSELLGGLNNQPVADVIADFCEEVSCARIVLVGWIDNAIRQIWMISESPLEIAQEIDVYRPEENGDMRIYFCSDRYTDILCIGLSRDDGSISVTRFRKSATLND
jgi:hypothetical protein